jgi:membrane protease YdiL (CAAX protease family)
LSSEPGSKRFYASTLAVAGVWVAGGVASGPLHRGWIQLHDRTVRRPVVVPVATGVAGFAAFYGLAQVALRIPPLASWISSVLAFADEGEDRLVLLTALTNAAAEEVFFRGAVFSAFGEDRPVLRTTALYSLSTVPTRNPALVLAAGVMGTLWAYQRRATNGIQAPVLTHLTWSALMLRYLPPVFRSVPTAEGLPG